MFLSQSTDITHLTVISLNFLVEVAGLCEPFDSVLLALVSLLTELAENR